MFPKTRPQNMGSLKLRPQPTEASKLRHFLLFKGIGKGCLSETTTSNKVAPNTLSKNIFASFFIVHSILRLSRHVKVNMVANDVEWGKLQ